MLHTPKPSTQARMDRDVLTKRPPPERIEPDILERPDGYYWQSEDGRQNFGPFETYEDAIADRDAASEEAIAPETFLHENEQAIGMADWIDPETGEPAEGKSPPHLPEE